MLLIYAQWQALLAKKIIFKIKEIRLYLAKQSLYYVFRGYSSILHTVFFFDQLKESNLVVTVFIDFRTIIVF